MKLLAIVPIAAAAVALSLAPAVAKTKKQHRMHQSQYEQSYGGGWNQGWHGSYGQGWNSRNVSGSDPSFGNQAGINRARASGRCVEDLGYGRFEYCGW